MVGGGISEVALQALFLRHHALRLVRGELLGSHPGAQRLDRLLGRVHLGALGGQVLAPRRHLGLERGDVLLKLHDELGEFLPVRLEHAQLLLLGRQRGPHRALGLNVLHELLLLRLAPGQQPLHLFGLRRHHAAVRTGKNHRACVRGCMWGGRVPPGVPVRANVCMECARARAFASDCNVCPGRVQEVPDYGAWGVVRCNRNTPILLVREGVTCAAKVAPKSCSSLS